MTISNQQLEQLKYGHQHGMLDHQLAAHANMSISSVKRNRKLLGLETNSVTAKLGSSGEQIIAFLATERELKVELRPTNGEVYDLKINGLRVDCKSTIQQPDGTWRFRLSSSRSSFYGAYTYQKDYVKDCEVLALICFKTDGGIPDVYFIESLHAPTEIRIRTIGQYEEFKDAWGVFKNLNSVTLQA